MPSICGMVRLTPKLRPEVSSIMLFGPGVIEVTKPKRAAADRTAGDIICTRTLHAFRPATHRGNAGARHLDEADHRHHGDETVDLVGPTRELEDEGGERRIEGAGPEGRGEAKGLDPVLALAGDLDEGEFALDGLALDREIAHAVHWHETLELALDLLDH